MPTFQVEAMVHSYHIYQDDCKSMIDEKLLVS